MVTDLLLRVALAGLQGGLIGLERQLRAKEAGLRTHIWVGIGSAMFMIVAKPSMALPIFSRTPTSGWIPAVSPRRSSPEWGFSTREPLSFRNKRLKG